MKTILSALVALAALAGAANATTLAPAPAQAETIVENCGYGH